jgi:RNA polymerase sigma factor (sigma-70 family)
MEAVQLYTDDELFSAMQKGDGNAFEQIYKRHWPGLYAAVYQRLCDRGRTEDVLQEIFACLWTKRAVLEVQNLKSYLHGMARYQVLQLVTRSKAPIAFFESFENLLLYAETPDEKIIAKELYEWVFRYAETLPEKKRAIFLLHIRDKCTTKEIAEKLSISQKTVQNQLGSALKGLRRYITPVVLALIGTRF